MNNLTQEDIKNILAVILIAPITGKEAVTIALLQQKLSGMLPKSTEEGRVPATEEKTTEQ